MHRVARSLLALCLAMAPWAVPAGAPTHAILEASVETTGSAVHFPDTLDGKIDLIGCATCADQALQLQATTTFTLNGVPVSLARARTVASGAANVQIAIHFARSTHLVTRVDLVSY
jgi:hypothetical protein